MKKHYLLCCLWMFFALFSAESALAQHNVRGTVTDSDGDPIIGVNVIEEGTSHGVITNVDGEYAFSVSSSDAVLQFSFIGFDDKVVPVEGRNEISIVLEESYQALDEVIVVGYGTQRRESVTGSVATVSSQEIERAPVANMSTVLGGRISGLTSHQSSGAPGADDATLLIRGRSTTGSSSPVVIVDGVQRDFNNLDPNEIESITLLKDASSAAVYGVQGANGVILVTTKRGVQQDAQITYRASYSVSQNTRFPDFMDGVQYAEAYNQARELDGLPPMFSDSDLEKIRYGDPDGVLGNTDWVDELFDSNAPTQHHNISVRGGTEGVNYFISLGYYDQEGSISNFNFQRYNVRSNIDAEITDNLGVSFDLAARLEERSRPLYGVGPNDWNNLVQQSIRAKPIVPMYAPDGIPTATRTASSIVNPIAGRDLSGTNESERSVFESSLTFDYDAPFVDGLNMRFMTSYDRNYRHGKAFTTPYKVQVLNQSSMSYQKQWAPNASSGIASLNETFSQGNRLTVQPSIRYETTIDDLHNINVLALYEQSNYLSNRFSASKRDFDFLDLPELDFGKEVRDADAVRGSSYESPRAGFVSRINYDYDSRYLVELASRYDGSYKFHSDNRWGFFPAASVGWVMSNEDFFETLNTPLTHLRFRASAGITGNDQISDYMYLSTMNILQHAVAFGDDLQNSIYTGSIPNPDITWETTTSYNIGFDSRLWYGLLGVEFDWFYEVTDDILRPVSGLYPPSMGGNFPATVNSGKVDNRGFDLTITHDNQVADFNYGARANVNWARNKILRIDESPNIPEHQSRIGRSIGEKDGLIALRLFESDEQAENYPAPAAGAQAGDIMYKDLNGDGKITYDQDRTFIGRSNIPELMFGLDLHAEWRGFDIAALFQGAAIADFALMGFYPGVGYDNTEFTRSFYHDGNSPVYLIEDSWTPDNPTAEYPRLSTVSRPNNGWASTFWIKDASYLRLRNLQIGYTIPSHILNNYGISDFRVYVGGSNLFTLSEFDYIDPEAPDVNNGYYPQQKTYTFGLSLTL
ncbi:TonB-dependent receptor [Marinilabiliaceae bacterium ANBcel2]|nr:TonB-dependent receptor [Marinilabiliaceae bacterium ANBcel2]